MSKIRTIYIILLYILVFNAHAGVCDQVVDPRTREDWVLINMCHFDNTVLVKIKNDRLRAWYNPLTHFRTPNVYDYEVDLLELFKGKLPKTNCMLQSTEAKFVISAGIKNTRQIVSFSEPGNCIVIEVSAIQESSEGLEAYARAIANRMKNESKDITRRSTGP